MEAGKKQPLVKDVWISIKSPAIEFGTGDGIELITEGKLFIEDGRYKVEYDESSITGMLGTRTTLAIAGDVITVMRQGKINSNFIFTKGQRQESMYETEFGNLPISVFTNSVDINFNENGGEVKVEYQIDLMNDIGRNYIHMNVREAGN